MQKPVKAATRIVKTGTMLAGAALASACASSSVSERLAQPELSPIENPVDVVGPDPVSMPLPAPRTRPQSANSLWRVGARSFFDDQRASQIGDILTVNVSISDRAQVANTTSRTRSGSQQATVGAFFGLDNVINRNLPDDFSITPGVNTNSSSNSNGQGSVARSESINLTVAAVIADQLANGNLVIGGSQEILVNNEVRVLLISGIIRPEDIASDNTVPHSKIAQLRFSYGGRGDLSDLQRARYGQRAAEGMIPF